MAPKKVAGRQSVSLSAKVSAASQKCEVKAVAETEIIDSRQLRSRLESLQLQLRELCEKHSHHCSGSFTIDILFLWAG
eukprot:2734050-Amphidinium_carterae.1